MGEKMSTKTRMEIQFTLFPNQVVTPKLEEGRQHNDKAITSSFSSHLTKHHGNPLNE